jgi:hypothetical protein
LKPFLNLIYLESHANFSEEEIFMQITHTEILSLEEAAEFLGVRPILIWEYVHRWIIPGKKVGKEWHAWQFNKADLLWLCDKRDYH